MVNKRPSDIIQEKKNRDKELEKFRKISGQTEDWMLEHARQVQNFYSAGVSITKASEDSDSIELEIDSSIDPAYIASIAFETGKTTIVNVKENNQDIVMENLSNEELTYEEINEVSDVALEQRVNEAMDETPETLESFEMDTRSGLRKFWDFMNKPFYIRSLFGLSSSNS